TPTSRRTARPPACRAAPPRSPRVRGGRATCTSPARTSTRRRPRPRTPGRCNTTSPTAAPRPAACCPPAPGTSTARAPPPVLFAATNYNIAENGTSVIVTLERIDNFGGALNATVHAVSGTAQNGHWGNGTGAQDFAVSWAAGEGGFKTVTIPVTDLAGAQG